MLDVCLLGCGGMMPLPSRFLTALLLRFNGKMLLIDCGEGTQVSLKMLGWGFKAIHTICFTHYHADHISGLPGMLLTIGNSGRTAPLKLIGPVGLKAIVDGLCKIAPELPYSLEFIELPQQEKPIIVDDFIIFPVEAEHNIPCFSYRVEIARKGKFDKAKAEKLQIPKILWSRLQNNERVAYNGQIYEPVSVMGKARHGIVVSYCTDSRPNENLVSLAHASDLFICEGMYGDNEKLSKAIENKHMLFSEAAKLAKQANVKELWLTHFSPSLSEPQEFLQYAADIFPNTQIGVDRMYKTLSYPQE